jgi:non-specific serine/threonine protein kinase
LIPPGFAEAIADRYRLGPELGEGGMATVHLADDLRHGRQVAIKITRAEAAGEAGPERFLGEIRIAAGLNHPNVLPLFDSGVAAGRLFYVMPYVAGESLRARLKRETRLPVEDALRLTREIAGALGHAHRRGLVHRDVKPENVLLSEGIALVADFGLARPAAPASLDTNADTQVDAGARTEAGMVLGTPLYMAPEQALGRTDLDGRADQYALACVAFEMLAGEPPFGGTTLAEVIARHLGEPPPALSARRPEVPAELSAVITRALAKSPADRWASMAGFAEALASAAQGAPSVTRSAATSATTPHNLPRPATRFIGRDRELTECTELLALTRVLTLTGPGGCGKTRLAVRLAERQLAEFPDGAWFVDLAPLTDGSRVALTVATALGVNETAGVPLLEALVAHLETRRALLVIDNAEHVRAESAALVDTVREGCPGVTLLTTSRERLGVEGEQVFLTPSLPVPPAGRDATGEDAAGDAVRLFVDRARLARADFARTPENAASIAEICRRLDGIPLAIELAAARVRVLQVDEIRARLHDGFRLLTGGSGPLPRQQTLRATIQWSVDLLAPAERALLLRLAVFASGWTLASAAAVSGEDADEFEVLDSLTRLADKSLVLPRRAGAGESRYVLLETVRQYAAERLEEAGEGDAARARLLRCMVALAGAAEQGLIGRDVGGWIARLADEQENVLAAHAGCDRDPDGARLGLRLVGPLRSYWIYRGLSALGLRETRAALERPGADARDDARALAVQAAGTLAYRLGRLDEAAAWLGEALTIGRERGDGTSVARALHQLGNVAVRGGDRAKGRSLLEEAVGVARAGGDTPRLSGALNDLAELARLEGDLARAVPLYEETLALARTAGNLEAVAVTLLNLAMAEMGAGATVPARARLAEAGARSAETGSFQIGQSVLDATAVLAAAAGDPARAARTWGASEAARTAHDIHRDPADEAFVEGGMRPAREALGEERFRAEALSGGALAYEDALAEARAWLERGGDANG